MGKVIAAIVVIALLIIGYVVFFDTDAEVEGEFEAPEVEVQGGEIPDVDVDVEAPTIGEQEVTVPTIEPADDGEADCAVDRLGHLQVRRLLVGRGQRRRAARCRLLSEGGGGGEPRRRRGTGGEERTAGERLGHARRTAKPVPYSLRKSPSGPM